MSLLLTFSWCCVNRFIYYVLSPFTVIISLSFWFMLFVLRGSLIVWFPGYGRWPSNAHQLHFINQQKLIDFVSRCLFIHFIVAPAKREEPPLNQSIKFICLLWIKVEWLAVCAASKTNWMPKEAEWNLMELNGMSWFRGRGALAPITHVINNLSQPTHQHINNEGRPFTNQTSFHFIQISLFVHCLHLVDELLEFY